MTYYIINAVLWVSETRPDATLEAQKRGCPIRVVKGEVVDFADRPGTT